MTDNYFIGINGIFHDTAVVVLSLKKNEPIIICSENRHSGIPHLKKNTILEKNIITQEEFPTTIS